jgi:hypothetical protein
MSEKRRGLGRGLGALIPSSAGANGAGNGAAVARPVDLFFPEGRRKADPSDAVLDSAPTEEPAAGTTAKSSSAERDTATKKSASTTASNGSVNPLEVLAQRARRYQQRPIPTGRVQKPTPARMVPASRRPQPRSLRRHLRTAVPSPPRSRQPYPLNPAVRPQWTMASIS